MCPPLSERRNGRPSIKEHGPKKTPEKKVAEQIKQWILELRQRCLGLQRIQSELKRLHDYSLSRQAIQSKTSAKVGTPCVIFEVIAAFKVSSSLRETGNLHSRKDFASWDTNGKMCFEGLHQDLRANLQ
jgi:hypothetical protein